jgi:hypothetical protein
VLWKKMKNGREVRRPDAGGSGVRSTWRSGLTEALL